MSAFEGQTQEVGDERQWNEYVVELQDFLHSEHTRFDLTDGAEQESQATDVSSTASAQVMEAVARGDFEPAALYLEQEIEKAQKDMDTAMVQSAIAPLEVRLAKLRKLKDGLERQ